MSLLFPAATFMSHLPLRRLAPVVLLGLLGSLCGCSHDSSAAQGLVTKKPEPEPLEAVILTVSEQTWPLIVRAQGSLIPDEVSSIGATVAGKVAEVHVDLGDAVEAGTPLVTFDQQGFALQVAQAEAQLMQARAAVGLKPEDPVESLKVENAPPVRQEKAMWDEAKARLERTTRLQAQNATTKETIDAGIAENDAAEARYLAARNSVNEKIALIGVRSSELAIARQRQDDSIVKAPFAGQVQMRHIAPGTYVQVGSPLVTIVSADTLRFRGTLPERYAQQLQLGQEVRLHLESMTEPLIVSIERISPSLDESSRALIFEARVKNTDRRFRTGLFAEAEVVLNPTARALVIPETALVEFAGAERVWKVIQGSAREQLVRTGQRRPEGIEILDGLSTGDVILMRAQDGREGKIVAIEAASTQNSAGSLGE